VEVKYVGQVTCGKIKSAYRILGMKPKQRSHVEHIDRWSVLKFISKKYGYQIQIIFIWIK
jgi:hypothetical protein